MHLTLLPYQSLLASLECMRKRQTWTTTPQNWEQWCRSALAPPFFPHLGNNAFEQDRLSKSLRFLTAWSQLLSLKRTGLQLNQIPPDSASLGDNGGRFSGIYSLTLCRFLWVSQALSEAGLEGDVSGPYGSLYVHWLSVSVSCVSQGPGGGHSTSVHGSGGTLGGGSALLKPWFLYQPMWWGQIAGFPKPRDRCWSA